MRQARWLAHVGGVRAPADMQDWLATPGSLTARLVAHSRRFRVQKVRQAGAVCLADEAAAIGLVRPQCVWEREVLLRCDGRPVVYGHTVVPMRATAHDWPLFSALGERSLGSTLFHDPLVRRGRLEFARLRPGHPLLTRARAALGAELTAASADHRSADHRSADHTSADHIYYARRCVYRRRQGLLLVTEVFLPAVLDLVATATNTK